MLDESVEAVRMKGGEEGKEEDEDEAGSVRSLGERNFVLGGTSGRDGVPVSALGDCLCGRRLNVMVTAWPKLSDEASEDVLEGLMFSLWPSTTTCPLYGSKTNSNAGFIGSVPRRSGG